MQTSVSAETRETRRARMWALASTLLALALTCIFPSAMGPLPEGMSTPIIAFELARTSAEVEAMFGPLGLERSVWRALMEVGNRVDYLFMLAYGGFYVTFARALAPGGVRGTRIAIALGVLAPLMDVAENRELLAIGSALGGSYAPALLRLQWFTWLKWFACCGVLLSWMPGLVRAGLLGRLVAALALFASGSALVAYAQRGVWAERMALGIILATSLAGALTLRRQVRPEAAPSGVNRSVMSLGSEQSAPLPSDEPNAVQAVPIDGVLDLHTFRPRDVEDVVREYVRACREANVLELRIIHGKGKGVQRDVVIRVLDALPEVASHRPAEPHRGGWGACIVDLRPR